MSKFLAMQAVGEAHVKDLEAELEEKRKTAVGFEKAVLDSIEFCPCLEGVSLVPFVLVPRVSDELMKMLEPMTLGFDSDLSTGVMLSAALKARNEACLKIKELLPEYNEEAKSVLEAAKIRATSMLEARGMTRDKNSVGLLFKKRSKATKEGIKKQRKDE